MWKTNQEKVTEEQMEMDWIYTTERPKQHSQIGT